MSTNTAQLSGNYDSDSHHSQNDYSDIMNLKRPIIPNHPPMSKENRAAQFAPFAALTTYNAVVAEVENNNTFTDNIIIPDEDQN